MSRGNAFSGVALKSTRCPIVAPAPSTAVVFPQSNSIAGLRSRSHSNRGYRRAFFSHEECLDGAEGIDGAET
jgi:hypothetical protein